MKKKLIQKTIALLLVFVLTFLPVSPETNHLIRASGATLEWDVYFNSTRSSLSISSKLSNDERICIQIGDTIYRSAYGAGELYFYSIVIEYPSQPIGTQVTCWLENNGGNKSDNRTFTIEECTLELDSHRSISAGWFQVSGSLSKSVGKNEYVVATIGDQTYRSNVVYNVQTYFENLFTIDYPVQYPGQTITLIAYDEHGCASKPLQVKVDDDRNLSAPEIEKTDVWATQGSVFVQENYMARLCAQIGNDIYYSDYQDTSNNETSTLTVHYPAQKGGTQIQFWIQLENGVYSKRTTETVPSFETRFSKHMRIRTTSIQGQVEETEWGTYDDPHIASAVVTIGGKSYEGEGYEGGYYEVAFPKQKVGTTGTITVTDVYGQQLTQSFKIVNIPIPLKINPVFNNHKKVTGKTVAKSKITLVIGYPIRGGGTRMKIITGKANKKGEFSIKIPKVTAGMEIDIESMAPNNFFENDTVKVTPVDSTIWLESNLFKDSKTAKIKVTNAFKGYQIKLTVGSKTYTKKITSNKKKQVHTIKLTGSHNIGNKVTASCIDDTGKRRDHVGSIIYFGNTIRVGMTSKQAELTTWGRPIRRNNWNGTHQWVFTSGSKTLYAYIRGEKVTAIQVLNY